jgi:hypothetical protein
MALTRLFKMLEIFAQDRNPYAPIIYKTLTFSLVENHQQLSIRELIMNNFKSIFETIQSIPVVIMLEPLLKQVIELSSFYFLDQSFRKYYILFQFL